MRGGVGSIGRRGGLLPSVLALVLLFRLLIPSGYMIAPDGDGRPGLILCAGQALTAAEPSLHDGHDAHPADPAPDPQEPPCAYAALAAPPLPPEPPLVPPRPFAAPLAPDRPAGSDLPRVARASPPPPARGPPLAV